MTAGGLTKDLDDGRPHTMPCPAGRHDEDPALPMLYVRHLATDDVWVLNCWSNPPCEYGEIAGLLNIETDLTRIIRSCPVSVLVAAYDHAEPGELPRLVFHPSQDDADSAVSPESHSGREMVYRGGANDVNLMLWAPEEADRSDSTLLVVGSEDAAMALMRAGVCQWGFTPVTWYRAVKHVEDDKQSADRANWARVQGRATAFWPVRTPESHAEMLRAAGMATVAGASRLLIVDPWGSGLGEGEDAASLTDPDEIRAVLRRMRELPTPRGDAEWDASPECEQERQPDLEADAYNKNSDIARILHIGVETATDVSMAVRVLREHGRNMALAYGLGDSTVEVYWQAGTGELEKRPDGLGVALWESRAKYLASLREALDRGDLSAEDHRVCIAHANRMDSAVGLRAVSDSLSTAYSILERIGAVPGGLSRVSIPRIDGDLRGLGSSDDRIAPDISRRLELEGRRPGTDADAWILGAVEVTGSLAHRLSTTALWEAAHSAAGSDENQKVVWGLTRRAVTTRAIYLHGLPRTRSVRIGGKVLSGWTGVRLVADRDVSGN